MWLVFGPPCLLLPSPPSSSGLSGLITFPYPLIFPAALIYFYFYFQVRKCIVAGFFTNAAKKDPQEGYKTMVEGTPVYIHPSSALYNKNPEWVIYHELVLTTKEYMRNVLAVEPKWLIELAPKFFKRGDPTVLSRAKRREKIEPLFNRFEVKDSWRISKRKG